MDNLTLRWSFSLNENCFYVIKNFFWNFLITMYSVSLSEIICLMDDEKKMLCSWRRKWIIVFTVSSKQPMKLSVSTVTNVHHFIYSYSRIREYIMVFWFTTSVTMLTTKWFNMKALHHLHFKSCTTTFTILF